MLDKLEMHLPWQLDVQTFPKNVQELAVGLPGYVLPVRCDCRFRGDALLAGLEEVKLVLCSLVLH